MLTLALLTCSPLLTQATPAVQENWPGWRGPSGSGIAAGAPPIEWSEEKNLRWKIELPGKGSSSPVVFGDLVFVTTAVAIGEEAEQEQQPRPERDAGGRVRGGSGRGGFGGRSAPPVEQAFLVVALDRASGEVVWEQEATTLTPHQGTHRDGSFASPTPVTDGELLIASFGSFGIFAYDFEGELLWEKDLGDMEIVRDFGEGSSPVLHGDTLIHNWDHGGSSFLVALNKRTGEELWRQEREAGTTWCTPIIIDAEAGPEVIVGAAETIAYDLKTGGERWRFGGESSEGSVASPRERSAEDASSGGGEPEGGGDRRGEGRSGFGQGGPGSRAGGGSGVITSPVVHAGVLLMSTGSRRGSFRAIEVSKLGPEMKANTKALLWTSEGDTPHVPSPIAYRGRFYSLKSNSGMLTAFDVRSGERLFGPERMKGLGDAYASPVAAGGRLYFVGRDGTSEVVRASDSFESLAVNVLDDEFDASPAIAGNEIFLRGSTHLYCISEAR